MNGMYKLIHLPQIWELDFYTTYKYIVQVCARSLCESEGNSVCKYCLIITMHNLLSMQTSGMRILVLLTLAQKILPVMFAVPK